MDNSWQIEQLIKRAFIRTKDRFISYFLAIIVAVLIFLATFILFGIAAIPAIVLIKAQPMIAAIMGVILAVGFIVALAYIGSWVTLAHVAILIQEPKQGVMETFKSVRDRVWGYVWLSIIVGLFIYGLIPLGILTLGLVLILWAVWGSFTLFIYLEKKKKGLANVWHSRALVSQKFWGIVWRVIVMYVGVLVLQFALAFGTQNTSVAALGGIGSGIISIFSGPFITSFLYEMYHMMKEPKEVKTPKVWIGLSILGWVLGLVLVVSLATIIPPFIQKNFNLKNLEKMSVQQEKSKMDNNVIEF